MVYNVIDTNLCKPDDGQARPKHVADVTSCRIKLSIVLCKDGLIQKNLSYVHSGIESVQFKFSARFMLCEVEISAHTRRMQLK